MRISCLSQSLLHQFRSGITPAGEEVLDDEDHVSTGVDHTSAGVNHARGVNTGMWFYNVVSNKTVMGSWMNYHSYNLRI